MCSEIPWGSVSGSSHARVAGVCWLRDVPLHQTVSRVHLCRDIANGICFFVDLLHIFVSLFKMHWCPLHYESGRLCISEGLARELQEFPAPEHWAKVVLNEVVSSTSSTRGCESSKPFPPWVQARVSHCCKWVYISLALESLSPSHSKIWESAFPGEDGVSAVFCWISILCFDKQAARIWCRAISPCQQCNFKNYCRWGAREVERISLKKWNLSTACFLKANKGALSYMFSSLFSRFTKAISPSLSSLMLSLKPTCKKNWK